MAHYRNRLLNYIRYNYSTYDCIAMIDFDIKGPININGVAHSFGTYNEWDTISAFGIMGSVVTFGLPYYYDLLAYNDYNSKYDFGSNVLHAIPLMYKINKSKIGDNAYKVKSGFCGLAFYKMYILTTHPEIKNYRDETNRLFYLIFWRRINGLIFQTVFVQNLVE